MVQFRLSEEVSDMGRIKEMERRGSDNRKSKEQGCGVRG